MGPAALASSGKGCLRKTVCPEVAYTSTAASLTREMCPKVGPMMYGFGDDNPANDTINVMEEILVDYVTEVVSGRPDSLLQACSTLTMDMAIRGSAFRHKR